LRKNIYLSAFTVAFFLLSSCGTGKLQVNGITQEASVREYSVQSVMWQQNAAEYRALCYQAFTIAKLRLDQFLESDQWEREKLAIVTDIDETILDNSPYNAKLIQEDKEYTQDSWKDWTDRVEAKAIPGAVEFLDYTASQGVEVFYVTNRKFSERKATLENLKKENFPFADNNHLLLRSETSAKQSRFDKVAENYKILLFIGDNLGDFSSAFNVSSSAERNELTDNLKERFGYDYIVLPNPMYGDWETNGIYEGKYEWNNREKDSIRKAKIYAY